MRLTKNRKILLCALALIAVFCIGYSSAIVINVLAPSYVGFWTSENKYSVLQIVTMKHKVVQHGNAVRTTIRLYNPSTSNIDFNMTVTYYATDGSELFEYVVSKTINAGKTESYKDTNTFDLTKWDNSADINIEATA
jgi:hypothetical protein